MLVEKLKMSKINRTVLIHNAKTRLQPAKSLKTR